MSKPLPASHVVEVWRIAGTQDGILFDAASFPPGAQVGQVACHECFGTGWWGYGPVEEVNGECVDCKGTGREWVGLA